MRGSSNCAKTINVCVKKAVACFAILFVVIVVVSAKFAANEHPNF